MFPVNPYNYKYLPVAKNVCRIMWENKDAAEKNMVGI